MHYSQPPLKNSPKYPDSSAIESNFLLCLAISLVCQLGDLFISYIKRKAKVKDTGRILPGHGGILDRLDGMFFAITFVFIYLNSFGEYFEIWKAVFSKL